MMPSVIARPWDQTANGTGVIYEKMSGSAGQASSTISQLSGNFGNNQFLIRIFLPGLARGYLSP
jgi:hypothetical protein